MPVSVHIGSVIYAGTGHDHDDGALSADMYWLLVLLEVIFVIINGSMQTYAKDNSNLQGTNQLVHMAALQIVFAVPSSELENSKTLQLEINNDTGWTSFHSQHDHSNKRRKACTLLRPPKHYRPGFRPGALKKVCGF